MNSLALRKNKTHFYATSVDYFLCSGEKKFLTKFFHFCPFLHLYCSVCHAAASIQFSLK